MLYEKIKNKVLKCSIHGHAGCSVAKFSLTEVSAHSYTLPYWYGAPTKQAPDKRIFVVSISVLLCFEG